MPDEEEVEEEEEKIGNAEIRHDGFATASVEFDRKDDVDET